MITTLSIFGRLGCYSSGVRRQTESLSVCLLLTLVLQEKIVDLLLYLSVVVQWIHSRVKVVDVCPGYVEHNGVIFDLITRAIFLVSIRGGWVGLLFILVDFALKQEQELLDEDNLEPRIVL